MSTGRRKWMLLFAIIPLFSCAKEELENSAASSLRFATWNIAHFNLGPDIYNRISTDELYTYYLPIYKSIFSQVNTDFINICEFESPFYAGHPEHSTQTELFNDYPYYKDDATSFGGHWVAFFSRFPLEDVTEVPFNTCPEGKYRYYLVGTAKMGGKDVKVVCTHLTHSAINIYAPEQMRQLIEDFESEPCVIILADWNSGPEDFIPLIEAGYSLANYYPDFRQTYYSTEYYQGRMDNIAVKGGTIINSGVFNTNEFAQNVLSDHYLFYCDVTF